MGEFQSDDQKAVIESQPPQVSLVLRCWVKENGEIYARLVDVHRQVPVQVSDINQLPGIIRRLLKRKAHQS